MPYYLSSFEKVGEFHRRFGLPVCGPGTEPSIVPPDVFEFRFRFLEEELAELKEAYDSGDLVGVADALADLEYVLHGTAHFFGIPQDRVLSEVHSANMRKVRSGGDGDPRSIRKSALDVVKPEGWTPPDVAGVLQGSYSPQPPEDWQSRYIRLASEAASWSKDPSTKNGTVIVGVDRRNISIGYNGFPPGISDDPERLSDRETRLALTQHAERNALDNARFDTRGASLYSTQMPCSECTKSLISRGVSLVVSPPPPSHEPWASDADWSKLMMDEAGVVRVEIPAVR